MTTSLRDFPPVEEEIQVPKTLRQSLLARHNVCPRSALLSMKYDQASHPMDGGTAFHAVVERAIYTLRDNGEVTMPGEQARELADAVMAEMTDLVLSTEIQDVVRLCAWNWAESFVLDWDTIVGVEVPLEMEIGGFTVTGRIDLIEAQGSTIYLRDWKTGLAIRKREEVQRGFQGMLYALLCLHGKTTKGMTFGSGINDVWFFETYPRYRSEDGTVIAKEGVWTRQELHDFKVSLERNLERFTDSLVTGDWPARSGSWCSTCPAPTECPIPAHLRFEGKTIESTEEAEAAFELKLAGERDNRRLQSALRGWVQEHGPIYVGDLAFDAKLSESRGVKNWDEMSSALVRTSDLGPELAPFEVTDHVELRQSSKFAKRKQTEEELDEHGSN